MTAAEKVAYLKGLAEGLGLDKDEKYGKVFTTLVDILEDLAYGLEEEQENSLNIGDELDALSEDLADVEDYLFGEDECDCDCDDCDCDCDDCDDDDCCCCGEDGEYCVVCPACGEELVLEAEDLESTIVNCPACGETLELEFEEDDEEDDEDED